MLQFMQKSAYTTAQRVPLPCFRAPMSPAPRKIVFHVPSLVGEEPAARPADSPSRLHPALDQPTSVPDRAFDAGAVRKRATLLEVSPALAGSLNLQAGLYGVLEGLE